MKQVLLVITALLIVVVTLPSLAFAESGEMELNRTFDNETIRLCAPDHFDLSAAQARGIADDAGFTPEYFRLQRFYIDALWAYVDEKCAISVADSLLRKDSLRFIPSDEPVSIYQRNCSNGLSFFFLRNNVYVERLTADQLDELRELCAAGAPEEAKGFVEGTLPDLICPYPDGEESLHVVYETYGLTAPNSALVFGMATMPEYDENDNFVDIDNEALKRKMLNAYAEKLTDELTKIMESPVTILVYG